MMFSDRGGRADNRMGSDWFIGQEPRHIRSDWAVHRSQGVCENPMVLSQKFSLNGKVMQDSSTERMTHNVYEMVSFASNMITLQPGDLVSMGSLRASGWSRSACVHEERRCLACTIEGIGTLTNPVVGP